MNHGGHGEHRGRKKEKKVSMESDTPFFIREHEFAIPLIIPDFLLRTLQSFVVKPLKSF